MGEQRPLHLESFEAFVDHPWVGALRPRYGRDAILARYAVARLVEDLHEIKDNSLSRNGQGVLVSIQGRVKTEMSFLRKLYCRALATASSQGLTQGSLRRIYSGIRDLAGVRFSCPYLDEIPATVETLIRPNLAKLGYATHLKGALLRDKNLLDEGNELGYRSYHFYVKVPTDIDIYGNSKLCLCEVQARSELQHVWALKSHSLFYKSEEGWTLGDRHVLEDMKQVSNSLRAADQHLMSIRDRVQQAIGRCPEET